ncbi:MAG: hypothetical protein ACRC2M_16220, partial [Planktothrix sp.]
QEWELISSEAIEVELLKMKNLDKLQNIQRLLSLATTSIIINSSIDQRSRQLRPEVYTKSGLMVGLGETDAEVREAMQDLRAVDCDILTLGQYLQPSPKHLPLVAFISPAQFNAWREFGESMGFLQVVASPLTRSSYHAEQVRGLMEEYPR